MEPSKVKHQHITLIEGYLRALADSAALRARYDVAVFLAPSTAALLSPGVVAALPVTPLEVIDGDTRKLVRKSLLELWVVVRHILRMRRDDVLFVSCLLPPAVYLLEMISRILPRRRVFITLHGEIDGVFDPTRQRPSSYGFWVKRWFRVRRRASWLNLVVIDRFIRDAMLATFPVLTADRLAVVEHPIVAHRGTVAAAPTPSAVFVGYRTIAKGFDRFAGFAQRHPAVDFTAVGGGIVESVGDGTIEPLAGDSDYINRVAAASVAVFPYTHGYSFSQSAAVLDALATGTHVLASDLACFRALHEAFGPDAMTICPDDAAFNARFADVDGLRTLAATRDARRARLATSRYSIPAVRHAFERLVLEPTAGATA